MFWKQPGFAATAVLTLALGIGATTAIFSVVYGVLLKPLPFHEPERLVSLLHTVPDGGPESRALPPISPIATTSGPSRTIGAWESNEVSITGRGEPEQVDALSVSDGDVAAACACSRCSAGCFNAEDDVPGSPLRVVLTHGYWQRRFGGADDVIGQSLEIDGTPRRSSACCRRRSSSCARRPHCCCRCSSIARDADHIEFDFQALARLKPGVDARPGECRRGAHDPAAAADVRRCCSCSRTCARWPTT